MKLVNLLIAIFWLYLLFDAYIQGRELPNFILKQDFPELPVVLSTCFILVLATSCGLFAFWQRRNIMEDMPILSSTVDRVFGKGAYRHFTLRLRPVCASVISSLVLAVVGLYSTYETTQNAWSYAICFGFLALALSMFIAYQSSKQFPPALR